VIHLTPQNCHKQNALCNILREKLKFNEFALIAADLSLDEVNALLALPEVDTPCRIRRARNRSGSAFDQQSEPGLVAGFMRSSDTSIKVLVIYTERYDEEDATGRQWGFVDVVQVGHHPACKTKPAPKSKAAATRKI
jgi:REP element-mobilizing transposase RayT